MQTRLYCNDSAPYYTISGFLSLVSIITLIPGMVDLLAL